MKPNGMVYLVGAGPGDAGLLTLRGAELLRRADVVVYDALVNADLLQLAPKSAEVFAVLQLALCVPGAAGAGEAPAPATAG